MDDAEAVAAIERKHELELLDRLLEERTRPVPPAPGRPKDQPLRRELADLMRLIAEALSSPQAFRAVVAA